MNPNHLRTFLAVRKHMNFTRAAEDVFLSQPAVSRQMAQLEQELGVSLFEQIGKSLHLTDAGRTLAREAEKILGSLERAGEAVRAHRSAGQGSLRLGASTTPGFYLLPSLLGRFHEAYPEVELHFSVESSLSVERSIVRNELDLGFVGAPPSEESLLGEAFTKDEIICFAGPSHPLARRRRIEPGALEGQTWVTRGKGSATRRLVDAWMARKGVKISRTVELGCPEAVKAIVANGLGISFMSSHGLRDPIKLGRLKKIPVRGLRLTRSLHLIRHGDKHISPVMGAFLNLVRKKFARKRKR